MRVRNDCSDNFFLHFFHYVYNNNDDNNNNIYLSNTQHKQEAKEKNKKFYIANK